MAYNKETAFKNQLNFLKEQMHCGYPNIERAAKKNYERMIAQLERQKIENKKIKEALKKVRKQ